MRQSPKSEMTSAPGRATRSGPTADGCTMIAAAPSVSQPAFPTARNPRTSPTSSWSSAETPPKRSVTVPVMKSAATTAPPIGSLTEEERSESSLKIIRLSAAGIQTPTISDPTIGSDSKIRTNLWWKGKAPIIPRRTRESVSATPAVSDEVVAYEGSVAESGMADRSSSATTMTVSSTPTVRRSRKTARARCASSLFPAASAESEALPTRRITIGARPIGIASARSMSARPKRATCPIAPARRP